jgi:peptidoglycan/LPS O-acetylase OafA/YrhL
MKDRIDYRTDIEGLRAVAVLAVLFYHLGWTAFSGGFVGVDVFFVISGYLITQIILSDVQAGRFSFRQFYARRAKRLLPALLVTLLLSFIPATLVMTPADFRDFAGSAIATTFSASNILFWTDAGYFAAESLTKPLLHTWSLAVEGQFYLVFPALIVCLLRVWPARFLPAALFLMLAASLGLNLVFQDGLSVAEGAGAFATWLADGSATIYFLAPFRGFEFLIGAMLVWTGRPKSPLLADILFVLGTLLVGYSVFVFTAETVFPSLNALIPCIGAACIMSGCNGRMSNVLRVSPLRLLGQASYSIYLVHWPIIVFWSYIKFSALDGVETGIAAVLSIAFGTLVYLSIERPMRRGSVIGTQLSPRATARWMTAGFAAVIATAASAAAGDGWSWRVSDQAFALSQKSGEATSAVSGALEGAYGCEKFCDFGDVSQDKIVLLVGDSHANHYVKALAERKDGIRYRLIQSAQCFIGATLKHNLKGTYAAACDRAREEFKRWIEDERVIAVVHSQHWSRYARMTSVDGAVVDLRTKWRERFLSEDVLKNYRRFNKKIILVGLTPKSNFKCSLRPTYFDMACPSIAGSYPGEAAHAIRAASASHPGRVALVEPAQVICPDGKCIHSIDGMPLYTDIHHLSVVGARLVAPAIVEALKDELTGS